jgi:hypothetical protein
MNDLPLENILHDIWCGTTGCHNGSLALLVTEEQMQCHNVTRGLKAAPGVLQN